MNNKNASAAVVVIGVAVIIAATTAIAATFSHKSLVQSTSSLVSKIFN